MMQSETRNPELAVLLLILLLAAALRLTLLGEKSLWFDEAFSVEFARWPIERLWEPAAVRPETHPPLYYHGLHLWVNRFGDSEAAIRLPSALISIVNVGLIYALGRRLFGHHTGILAAALLTVSPLSIWYAQEARMYIFMTAVLLVAALLLTWDSWWAMPPLAVTFAVGLYLDYTMLPIWSLLSAIWFDVWWQRGRPRRPFLVWLSASLAAWLLFMPWLPQFYRVLEAFSTVHIFVELQQSVGLPYLTPAQYLLVMAAGALFLIPVVAALQFLQENEGSRTWFSGVVLVSFVLATLLFPVPRLFGIKRILVQVWPLVILWVAWIINHLGSRRRRVMWSVLALSLAASLTALLVVAKDDWRGSVAYVNEQGHPGDVAWIDPVYNKLSVSYYDLNLPAETGREPALPEQEAADIWLFAERFPGGAIPSSPGEAWLDENMKLLEAVPFYRLEVRRYAARAQ